jgi:hypothetical protein
VAERDAGTGKAHLRSEGFDHADHLGLLAGKESDVVRRIGHVHERDVMDRVDPVRGQLATHVQVLRAAARGGHAERLAFRLVARDGLLQAVPIARPHAELLAHDHVGAAIDVARDRHHVEAAVDRGHVVEVRDLGNVDPL